MFFVMAIAGMVCTALCSSGQFITDLKAGYWIGSTPAAQEKVKFIGVIAAAITAGLDDRAAGARLSVRRSRARRHAADSGCAAGIHHEGAGGGIHEPPAGRLPAVWHRRHGHGDYGDAGQVVAWFLRWECICRWV